MKHYNIKPMDGNALSGVTWHFRS